MLNKWWVTTKGQHFGVRPSTSVKQCRNLHRFFSPAVISYDTKVSLFLADVIEHMTYPQRVQATESAKGIHPLAGSFLPDAHLLVSRWLAHSQHRHSVYVFE